MASGAVSQDGPVIGGGHECSRKPGKTAPTVEQLDAAAQSRKDSDARDCQECPSGCLCDIRYSVAGKK